MQLFSLTDRQTAFFSHNFSWTFFFFKERKKGSKSVRIVSFATLTEEDIDIIRQRVFNVL